MMPCPYQEICGGCSFRHLAQKEYVEKKKSDFKEMISDVSQEKINFGDPIFVGDNTRRRATLAFTYAKGKFLLGFNRRKSKDVIDIYDCNLLTPRLNRNLDNIRNLMQKICSIPLVVKGKKGRASNTVTVNKGDIWLCDADNGIDMVLEFDHDLSLEYRMLIFEATQQYPEIIRISHRHRPDSVSEPIIEKTKPIIKMGGYDVFIPAGTFLQASKESETALVSLVLKYMGETKGRIADLFCGVGTFSYPLARSKENSVFAVDSSPALVTAFRGSVYKNMITNIEVSEKNLFKYPLSDKDLSGFTAVIFDPPRAGASAQVAKLAALSTKPQKIIAVSCNPHSFVKDANTLLNAGYKINEITLVDQFSYSNHIELVALFTPVAEVPGKEA